MKRIEEARTILKTNDRGGYTVPTPRLYPFQWNWDSAFVAMGFGIYDLNRGLQELEWLIKGQWADGMIPHIIFHAPADSYFPGPEIWGTHHSIPTSGITQPPVFGMAVKSLFDRANGRYRERFIALVEAGLASHRWWLQARDPDQIGLVSLLHPWESGSDNSPLWDVAMQRVPTSTITAVKRKDVSHVEAAMRPSDEDYQRFIHLVDIYRMCGWRAKEMWEKAPFKMADVQITAILARSSETLAAVSEALSLPYADEFHAQAQHLQKGLMGQFKPHLGRFISKDLISGEDNSTPTQSCYIPLLALDLSTDQREKIRLAYQKAQKGLKLGLATSPQDAHGFDAKRYWRGPVWAIINWLMIEGFTRNAIFEEAQDLRKNTIQAIDMGGFAEYFDPQTGEGLGGLNFSWTSAAYLHLCEQEKDYI